MAGRDRTELAGGWEARLALLQWKLVEKQAVATESVGGGGVGVRSSWGLALPVCPSI